MLMKNICIIVSSLLSAIVVMLLICNVKLDYMLELNVEALSQVEHGKYIRCYDQVMNDPTEEAIYCQICKSIPGREYNVLNFCIPQ